jgi:hypothetical protein
MRNHLVVPNVSWGLGFNHELDLLSISRAGFGTEIEIKISRYDLMRDKRKAHEHFDPRIRQLYFAGPEELRDDLFLYVPEKAGIITVHKLNAPRRQRYQAVVRRKAKPTNAQAFKDADIVRLLRLGNMRYWSMLGKALEKGVLK